MVLSPDNGIYFKGIYLWGSSKSIAELPKDGKWIITDIDLTNIDHFGGWSTASEKHFADDGVFDSFYEEK